jgi:methylated-DNA-[protein]-cysteine S-methyltransferase
MRTFERHLMFSTTFGDMAILYRDNPFLMTEILLPCENTEELANKWGKAGYNPNADIVAEAICDYFDGKIIGVPYEWMDMGSLTALQQQVLMRVAHIPYGQTRSYKAIAQEIGRPNACRFVGTSVAKNPFPLLIPCHRVIRTDGRIGKFGGGTEMKRQLLALESKKAI